MPTILELFKGSNKDITPKPSDETPIEKKFKGSTQEKSVKSDQLSKIEQEFTGVRFKSGVELNNPLLYGNQAIRIATRSTSDVEKMKQATGGSAGDGGLIGKGLGAITGGKFGQFVFGGKVTSLNQARDGINSRIGIPTNLIPTNVYNTGGLQAGIEPDTMITLGKIRDKGAGTDVGKFLKQTGGGTPKTIGNQILGGGISLLKGKLRTTLFGNPNTMGSNSADSIDSFSGVDSGKKTPANGGWEYSSKLPYSKQISTAKYNTKSVDGFAESAKTNIIKQTTFLNLEAKKKLGEAAKNTTDLLKKQLTGKESKQEIDKVLESEIKVTSTDAKTYSAKNINLTELKSSYTNLKLPELEKKAQLEREKAEAEKAKKKLGLPEGFTKPKLSGTESKSELDKVTESKTKETSATPKTYTEKIGDYKNEDVTKRIDLSLVSPVKGIDRRKTKGRFGTTEYALFDPKNATGGFSPNDPTRPYTGVAGNQKKYTLETKYGLTSKGDALNMIKEGSSTDKLGDLIPLQIGAVNDGGKIVHFRTLITGFSETLSPSWDSSKFVGNPYPFWTYSGVERSASFTLRMYCMNADELSVMWEKLNWLTAKVYPTIVDKLVQAPFINMTIGSIYKNRVGFINSLSYTINDDITWETDMKDMYLPKVVDVQIEFKLIDTAGVEAKPLYNYGLSQDAVKGINNKRGAQSGNVVGTDPITNPKPASQLNFDKVGSTQQLKPPTPPKVDNTGVDQTEPPPAQKDNTPKSLDTGKPAETPKTESKPDSTTAIFKISETEFIVKRDAAAKQYKGQGYPDWLALRLGASEAAGRTINEIKKIDEKSYYVELKMSDGEIRQQVHYLYMGRVIGVDSQPTGQRVERSTYVSYEKWVSDNDGKDPMNKYFKKEDTTNLTTPKQ